MKTKLCLCSMMSVLLLDLNAAVAQPVITCFSQNGVLSCSNLAPGSAATVVWSSSVSGPWQTSWETLTDAGVDSNGVLHISVPMFYRVMGFSPETLSYGMVTIPAGWFTMGDTLDGDSDAIPTNVYVSAFLTDSNLVSYSQWQTVYAYAINHGYDITNSALGKAPNHPVVNVSWCECLKWCNARSQRAGLTPVYYTDAGLTQVYTNGTMVPYANWAANGFRLPTEAEWEKAARGGVAGQRFPWGNTISESQANYYAMPGTFSYDLGPYSGYNTNFNSGGQPCTSPVGYFAPNGYGLFDVAGNAAELCWDCYGTPYGQPTTNNPTGLVGSISSNRITRGGSGVSPILDAMAYACRCASRYTIGPTLARNNTGFRCVRGH